MLSRKYNLRYIEIPVTLKMRTRRFSDMAFFGQLGLNTGFNIGAKSKDQFEYTNEDGELISLNEEENEIKDQINLLNASFIIGIGLEYFVDESISIIAGINYLGGFTNILNNSNTVDPTIEEKAQLQSVEFVIGVIF